MPKERFSVAGRALRRLYEHTPIAFKLIIVDCDIPPRFLAEIKDAVRGQENVEFLKADGPILTNACKALVAEASSDELTCMLENDLLVTEGWLESLIAAMEETGADVATPRVLEGDDLHYHDDGHIGALNFQQGEQGAELHFLPLGTSRELDRLEEPRMVTMAEAHCYLFRTSVLKRVQVFDPALTCREEFDICLELDAAKVPMVFQPTSRIVFMPPPPVHPDEKPYFLHKWDINDVKWTHEYIKQKWNLTGIPPGYGMVELRHHQMSRWAWFKYRALSRWYRAPFKAWKTLRQNTLDRLSRRSNGLSL